MTISTAMESEASALSLCNNKPGMTILRALQIYPTLLPEQRREAQGPPLNLEQLFNRTQTTQCQSNLSVPQHTQK